MRVLHVNDHLAPKGGVETYLLSVIPELESAGFAQGVAFSTGNESLVPNAFQVSCLSDPGWISKRNVHAQLDQVLDAFQPDLVHLHSIYNADAIEYLLDKKPVVLTSHDYRYLCPASNFYYRRTEQQCNRTCSAACFAVTLAKKCLTLRPKYGIKYFKRVRRVVARFADFRHLIAPSQSAADRFEQSGFPADRISVLPYFCRIKPLSQPRPVPDQPLVLYLGRLSANKGWRCFVEAFKLLPNQFQGMIVGNMTPDTERILRKDADAAVLAGRLNWRAWATAEEISDVLQKTSVLVFPSLWPETLGIVGLEAMAHGVPVVASDIGGVSEWLKEGETGFKVPPGDANAIAAAINRIVNDKNLALRMGLAALELLRQRFLPEHHLGKLKSIYEAAVA